MGENKRRGVPPPLVPNAEDLKTLAAYDRAGCDPVFFPGVRSDFRYKAKRLREVLKARGVEAPPPPNLIRADDPPVDANGDWKRR